MNPLPDPSSRYYLCGPMTSRLCHSHDLFTTAKRALMHAGFVNLHSPFEHAVALRWIDSDGFLISENDPPLTKEIITESIRTLLACDGVILLTDDTSSKGVVSETTVARWAGLHIYHFSTILPNVSL